MSLLSAKNSKGTHFHPQSLALLNDAQCTCLKGTFLDTEASLLSLTKCFNLLDAEIIPDCRLLDSFPNRIFFHPYNHSNLNNCNTHLESLDHLCLEASSFSSTLVVVTDASTIPSRNMQAIFFFIFDHQFITQCLFTVCSRLSTISSLQFWPQETKTPLIGRETQLESTEFKEKSK